MQGDKASQKQLNVPSSCPYSFRTNCCNFTDIAIDLLIGSHLKNFNDIVKRNG